MLDARNASALNKIIQNSHFKKKVSLEEQKTQKADRFPRGIQIAFMIYDYFRVTCAHDTVLDCADLFFVSHSSWRQCSGIRYRMGWSSNLYVKDSIRRWCLGKSLQNVKTCVRATQNRANDSVESYADLFTISLRNDDIQEFDSKWDGILLSITKLPSDDILEGLYKIKNTRVWETQDRSGTARHGNSSEDIDAQSKTMVKRRKDQKLRFPNFDARHGRIETGAVVKNRKGMSGVEGGKGICHQWKEKDQCSKGDQCSFRHESKDHAQKADHKAATPSKPSMSRGRSVSKKRSIQGRSKHGATLQQQCRYYLKSTCTRSPCEYWHPPECQFYKTETGCKARDKCMFPHRKVDEQPHKKAKESLLFPQRRENDDKNAVGIVKIVPHLGCVSQDSEAFFLKEERRQPRGNRMQKVFGPIRRIRLTQATPRQASIGEKKGHRLEKYKSKILIGEVTTLWNLRTGPIKRLKDNSGAPKQGLESCQKHIQAQRNGQSNILLARGGMGTLGCVNERAGGKRVCGGFRSEYAYG